MTKTKLIFAAALAFVVSCANDDTTNKQTEQEPGTEGLTSFVEEDQATRTTGEYDGSGLNFYWTAGDRLWVNNGTLIQDSKNNISKKLIASTIPSGVQRATRANFWFSGTFTASSYPVRYTGKNGVADKVTIKASQSQTIPNDASHIGENGDFGVATATKPTGSDAYSFTLDHKAAYITFMPYTTQAWGPNAVIRKIRVYTSNPSDALAGTFDLADDGTLSNPASTSNSVELTVPNFSIPSASNYTTNGATMVVNPGTYNNVSIEYTLHDPVSSTTGTVTKTYPSVTFAAGRNKKVKTDLQVTIYPGNPYYQWDAQQHYWAGYEWDGANPTQPTINYASNTADAPQSTKLVSAHTPRDFNDIQGYTGGAAVLPTTSRFQACPNINELCWYVQEGKPHWDTELWAMMNHLYAGGMWFRKLSAIAAAQIPSKTVADLKAAAPDGIDYTRSFSIASSAYSSFKNFSVTPGKPSNLSDYFYLPAFGLYYMGALQFAGSDGHYWTSTPGGTDKYSAYSLYFISAFVYINSDYRFDGLRLWTAQ